MNTLAVEHITVSYDGTNALQDFSLNVAPGEIMAVVGPSGSGKSTLLRAIAGLEPLQSGSISFGGEDLRHVPTHRRNLGLMFQDHGLFAHLNVADNIGYGLKIAGRDKTERTQRVRELLDLVGLSGFERRGTAELSGGEAQRVALARALAPSPGLLMLDEPLGSLDRALREQLTGELRRLLTEIGQTAVHVTHDQAEAFALADRVAVVADGRVVAVGAPGELWRAPGTRFVAEFLGHPNIWSVTVDDDGSVRWAHRAIGSLSADHVLRGGGVQQAVLPATAIVIAPDAAAGAESAGDLAPRLDVTVVEAVFRAGVHDVVAAVVGRDEGDDTPDTVAFTTSRPVTAGEQLALTVDVDLLTPIDD